LRTPRPTHLAALPAALPISDGATHGRRRVPPPDVDGCDPRSLEGTTHARHRVQPTVVHGCDPRSPEGPTRRHRRGQTPTRHTGADAPVFLSWTRAPTSTLTREAFHDPKTPQRTPLPTPLRRLQRPGPRPAPLRRDLESDGHTLFRVDHDRKSAV